MGEHLSVIDEKDIVKRAGILIKEIVSLNRQKLLREELTYFVLHDSYFYFYKKSIENDKFSIRLSPIR